MRFMSRRGYGLPVGHTYPLRHVALAPMAETDDAPVDEDWMQPKGVRSRVVITESGDGWIVQCSRVTPSCSELHLSPFETEIDALAAAAEHGLTHPAE